MSAMAVHLHLDCVGGISGDMFLAALLDAHPEARPALDAAVARLSGPGGGPGELAIVAEAHADHVFAGTRVSVRHPPEHAHRTLRQVFDRLAAAGLDPAVRARAEDMFRRLAACEARIHGVGLDQVQMHEVSAWDSIADIVGAAALIEALGIASCTVSSLPFGAGRVRSAHGPLPVPAPATSMLLDGFRVVDDGQPGERVTPTGAVILRHLEASQQPLTGPHSIGRQGFGFGSRKLPGISNVLRALFLTPGNATHAESPLRERIGEVAFEIDDQSGEELAAALDALRGEDGVLDVLQSPAFGKKGRSVVQVRVLCALPRRDAVATACLSLTASLGVRLGECERLVLPRHVVTTTVDGVPIRVKLVRRPDGSRTAKAEMDDLAGVPSQRRRRLRQAAEEQALRHVDDGDA